MTTAAQIEANRANAQRSTGPKATGCKARVAQTALTHGLTARRLAAIPCGPFVEDPDCVDDPCGRIVEELAPPLSTLATGAPPPRAMTWRDTSLRGARLGKGLGLRLILTSRQFCNATATVLWAESVIGPAGQPTSIHCSTARWRELRDRGVGTSPSDHWERASVASGEGWHYAVPGVEGRKPQRAPGV